MLVERAAKYIQPRKKEEAEKGHGLNTDGTCASKVAKCESTDSSDSETSVTETSSKSGTSAKSGKSEFSGKSNTSGESVTSGFVNVKCEGMYSLVFIAI
jgi:DNA gyrase/topoisomerase IV subunit B